MNAGSHLSLANVQDEPRPLGAVGSGVWLGLFLICARRIRLRDYDVGSDGTAAFFAEAFDNYLSVFFELPWLSHPKISFVADVAPRVVGQPLPLAR